VNTMRIERIRAKPWTGIRFWSIAIGTLLPLLASSAVAQLGPKPEPLNLFQMVARSDLVVLVDPEAFGEGIEGAVDRYVAMTRATQQLVILTSS